MATHPKRDNSKRSRTTASTRVPSTQSRAKGASPAPARGSDEGVPQTQRLGLNLSKSVYDELSKMARDRRSSMTEVVRLGLGLAKIAINEANRGNKLIVTTEQGDPLREIVLP